MANVIIKIDGVLEDGHKVTFKAPCHCSAVEFLDVRYVKNGEQRSELFTMVDAHGKDLLNVGNLFAKDSYVSIVLDTVNNRAFVQNADTNKYLEEKIAGVRSDLDDFMVTVNTMLEVRTYENFRTSPQPLNISCDGIYRGKTILLVVSAMEASGIQTVSEVGMIWCGYDGNNFNYMPIKCYSLGSSLETAISITQQNGMLYIQCNKATVGKVMMLVCD